MLTPEKSTRFCLWRVKNYYWITDWNTHWRTGTLPIQACAITSERNWNKSYLGEESVQLIGAVDILSGGETKLFKLLLVWDSFWELAWIRTKFRKLTEVYHEVRPSDPWPYKWRVTNECMVCTWSCRAMHAGIVKWMQLELWSSKNSLSVDFYFFQL